MAGSMSINAIIGAIFGAILIVYLIVAVFNDIGDEVQAVNTSHSGANLIVLIPLFLAFGVVIGLYHLLTKR